MKYYYITGVSRGIGKAIAEYLLQDDNTYVIGISRKNTLEHERYKHFSIDLSDIEEIASFKFEDFKDAEAIALINNAGTLGEIKRMGSLSTLDLIRTTNLNVIAPSVLMNSFIKQYQAVDCKKVIINVTSGAALNPYDGWSAYCSSKAAVNMFSRVADKEQAMQQYPINVLAVAPGVVETEMQYQIRETDESDFSMRQKFIKLKRDGLLYTPKAVAKAFGDILETPSIVEDVVYRVVLES